MCPTRKSPLAHPLSLLRRKEGLSHAGYAQLVARKHAELGFGSMAARREKIARWESGKVTPELTAQFTIARLHGVPRSEVLRLGWPHWLHIAGGSSVPLGAPWTAEEALRSLHLLARPQQAPVLDDVLFTVCTAPLDQLVAHWLESFRTPPSPPEREGHPVADVTVAALEGRHRQLRRLLPTEAPSASRLLADAELRVVTELLHTAGYGPESGARLLSAAARAACLSGLLAYELDDQARAQAAYVAAVRAAALVHDHELGLWALLLLAAQQIGQGAPANALRLLAPADQPPHVPLRAASPLPPLVDAARRTARALLVETDGTPRHRPDRSPEPSGHPSPAERFTELETLIRHAFTYDTTPTGAVPAQAHRGHSPSPGIRARERIG
ncbi:hypothetical protein [Streptomyces melanogenes]|uniref:XRE family transcriptional regulator n=1 Tax=Streptomyces melanogenes TaxID=67326 RepID=A0ABZ1XVU3_9ACTN|nr:hypothetical protein [Streptomyces melanogenes]